MPTKLNEFQVTSDNAVDEDVDLIHFAMVADSKPISYKEALREQVWKNAMVEELKAIEKNQTWKLSKLPHDNKSIDVK